MRSLTQLIHQLYSIFFSLVGALFYEFLNEKIKEIQKLLISTVPLRSRDHQQAKKKSENQQNKSYPTT